ncbi:hypothetical protein [Pseudonocardia sp. DLS-67]
MPARHFGLDDRGRISPGLRADLVLVAGDPTADIRATAAIVDVWRRGVRHERPRSRTSGGEGCLAARRVAALTTPKCHLSAMREPSEMRALDARGLQPDHCSRRVPVGC